MSRKVRTGPETLHTKSRALDCNRGAPTAAHVIAEPNVGLRPTWGVSLARPLVGRPRRGRPSRSAPSWDRDGQLAGAARSKDAHVGAWLRSTAGRSGLLGLPFAAAR